MDVAIVGDAEPVPFAEREESAQPRARDRARNVCAPRPRSQTDIHERSAGVWHAILAAASDDPEVEQWRRSSNWAARRDRRSLGLIFGREIDERLVDVCWALFSAEVYTKLTGDGGWSRADYEQWLSDATARLLGVEPVEPA